MNLINEDQSQRTPESEPSGTSASGDQPVSHTSKPNPLLIIMVLGLCVLIFIVLVAVLAAIFLSADKEDPTPQQPLTASEEVVDTAAEIDSDTQLSDAKETQSQLADPAAKPIAMAKPDQKIIDWIKESTVTGLRITPTSSKVILNGKSFMPGNVVNMELGLKVHAIEEYRILFIDSNSVEYMKAL